MFLLLNQVFIVQQIKDSRKSSYMRTDQLNELSVKSQEQISNIRNVTSTISKGSISSQDDVKAEDKGYLNDEGLGRSTHQIIEMIPNMSTIFGALILMIAKVRWIEMIQQNQQMLMSLFTRKTLNLLKIMISSATRRFV